MAEEATANRARRMWLMDRLQWARRSLDLLDRKRVILLEERRRLARRLDDAEARWTSVVAEVRIWSTRASAVGGSLDLVLAASAVPAASVEVPWANAVGVRYPDWPRTDCAALGGVGAAAVSDTVGRAADAYSAAIGAAAECAAAQMAFHIIDTEVRATRRRHRALEKHRIPALEEELARLELRLDEVEREQHVATRWARQQMAMREVVRAERP
jgi:V/A-type H+-transporting ATPase subunit D